MTSRGAWASAPAALLLAVPFSTLISLTPWSKLALSPGDGRAVAVSTGLGLIALVLIALLGTPLALWLARSRSRWRAPVQTLVMAALLTPPLAMGILLVNAYGPYGPVGQPLERLGLALTNNAAAFLLAQLYGGLSYFVLSAKAAFESVPLALQEAAADLGASGWQVFRHITLPLAWRALATGLAIAWVRVIGEFGIVMIFAYFPQGIPVRLYVNLQNSGVEAVYVLVWLLLLVTLPLPVLLMGRRQSKFA